MHIDLLNVVHCVTLTIFGLSLMYSRFTRRQGVYCRTVRDDRHVQQMMLVMDHIHRDRYSPKSREMPLFFQEFHECIAFYIKKNEFFSCHF